MKLLDLLEDNFIRVGQGPLQLKKINFQNIGSLGNAKVLQNLYQISR